MEAMFEIEVFNRGRHTTLENENYPENEKLLRNLRSHPGPLFVEVLWQSFGAVSSMDNESLRSIYWVCWLYWHWNRQQQEIADKNRREVKAQLRRGERREWKITFSFSENGEWRILLHRWRRIMNLREWIFPTAKQPIAPRHVPILGE